MLWRRKQSTGNCGKSLQIPTVPSASLSLCWVVLGTLVSCFFRVGCDRSKAASLHATLDLFLLRKNEEQRRDPVVQTKMLGGESKQRQVAVVLSKGEQTSSMLL